jgi:hypothetical protein
VTLSASAGGSLLPIARAKQFLQLLGFAFSILLSKSGVRLLNEITIMFLQIDNR